VASTDSHRNSFKDGFGGPIRDYFSRLSVDYTPGFARVPADDMSSGSV